MNKSDLQQIIREELQKAQQTVDIYKTNSLRGIQKIIKDNPDAQNFVGKELIKLGKERLRDLSTEEAMYLNTKVLQKYAKPQISPSSTSDIDPYILGKGKDYMGSTYTGD